MKSENPIPSPEAADKKGKWKPRGTTEKETQTDREDHR
jgi:hypothetical protein